LSAWFAGDFERCLELCDAVRGRDPATRAHVALARARALVRLNRFDDALGILRDAPPMAEGSDEELTARMLTGEAHVRRGDAAHGLAVLRQAQAAANGAHPTIRSEIALNVGFALYCLHDYGAAERALSEVAADEDLISVRATSYHAWMAYARGEAERATTLFVETLRAFDACRHDDRYFEANSVRALAHLAVERLDPPAWNVVRERVARIDWASPALAQPHFFIAYCAAAYHLDVDGDPVEAAREAREAERIAPSDAFRVQARCKRASIARAVAEPVAQRDHVESAAELFATLDPNGLAGDEKIVPLVLAEQLATLGSDRALSLLERYRGLVPIAPMKFLAQSRLGEAYHTAVEAVVREQAGHSDVAIRRYREALDTFRQCGYTRRAAFAALALWRLTGNRAFHKYADSVTSHLPARSWIRREIEAAKTRAARLTPAQREVLCLICEGKSNPEIARLRKRSLHTIRNLVARLFHVFDVASREQLAVECVRRGLYTPS
jgi:DNA-binding CsgD family transcriptional regulator/tetratricopeptide (TPR) repeat protein